MTHRRVTTARVEHLSVTDIRPDCARNGTELHPDVMRVVHPDNTVRSTDPDPRPEGHPMTSATDERPDEAERVDETPGAGEPQLPPAPVDTAEQDSSISARLVVAGLVLVTGLAVLGQVATVYDLLTERGVGTIGAGLGEHWQVRVALAAAAAAAFETLSLNVQYQAHKMGLLKATLKAAKHRRISYVLAVGAACIQYWHFSGPGGSPTPLAIILAAFSAVGPWLWGLHTSHVKQLHLLREGRADVAGATFSSERWRTFPYRTLKARRTSIDLGLTDPLRAWEAQRRIDIARRAVREQGRPGLFRRLVAAVRPPVVDVSGDGGPVEVEQAPDVDAPAWVPADLTDDDEDEPQRLDWWFDEGDTEELDPRDVRDLINLRGGDQDERDEFDEDDTAAPPATVEEALARGWRRVRLERHFGLTEHKAKEAVRKFNAANNGHRQGAHS